LYSLKVGKSKQRYGIGEINKFFGKDSGFISRELDLQLHNNKYETNEEKAFREKLI
jgi:hypothetical protein